MSARLVHLVDQLSAVAGTLQPHGSMTVTLSREDMTELLDATAAVERVRALHTPSRWYLDYCDDPACEREHVECNYDLFHDDDYRLVCETCSGGELEDTDDPTPYPCPTIRALDESETVHD